MISNYPSISQFQQFVELKDFRPPSKKEYARYVCVTGGGCTLGPLRSKLPLGIGGVSVTFSSVSVSCPKRNKRLSATEALGLTEEPCNLGIDLFRVCDGCHVPEAGKPHGVHARQYR
jgi:hypothetical protein